MNCDVVEVTEGLSGVTTLLELGRTWGLLVTGEKIVELGCDEEDVDLNKSS